VKRLDREYQKKYRELSRKLEEVEEERDSLLKFKSKGEDTRLRADSSNEKLDQLELERKDMDRRYMLPLVTIFPPPPH
jgi:hypothetical protein